jgi:hypothetical protein
MATREPIEVEGTLEEYESEPVELPNSTNIVALDRALIDVQIATAKQYPRQIKVAFDRALRLATQDEETAGSMFYMLPRKQDGKRIFIEGPSVRLAEIIAHVWGNLRIKKRVTAITDTHVVSEGVCWDLENNVAMAAEAQRRITDKKGRRYSDDMIVTTANAAASIGLRNAVFSVIPRALWQKLLVASQAKARGEGTPIEVRRQNALAWFARYGRQEDEVLLLLGVEHANNIGEDEMEKLVGLKTAIMEGTTTIEAVFEDVDAAGEEGGKSAATQAINDRIKNAGQTPPEKKPAQPPEQKPAQPPEKKKPEAEEEKPAKATPEQVNKYAEEMGNALDLGEYKGAGRRAAQVEWQKEHIGKADTSTWGAQDYERAINMLATGILP